MSESEDLIVGVFSPAVSRAIRCDDGAVITYNGNTVITLKPISGDGIHIVIGKHRMILRDDGTLRIMQ